MFPLYATFNYYGDWFFSLEDLIIQLRFIVLVVKTENYYLRKKPFDIGVLMYETPYVAFDCHCCVVFHGCVRHKQTLHHTTCKYNVHIPCVSL